MGDLPTEEFILGAQGHWVWGFAVAFLSLLSLCLSLSLFMIRS